ncbi:hypothetical protein FOA52_005057 [Chlamydomonas sp. UWO 241]|nr:hypothetical protein FOA52_005057 [Chlamydomonas sp. UWO 241]
MADAEAAVAPIAAAGELQEVPPGFTVRTEGMASILYKGNDVFYNEAQVTNRDLSMAVLRHFLPIHAAEKADGKYKPKRDNAGRRNKENMQMERQKREEAAAASTSDGAAAAPQSARPQGATLLEGLAASGLRSIRYAREVPGLSKIVANDLDPEVVASMKRNTAFNGPEVQSLIDCRCSDARLVMMGADKFDAVDLDPYGTPAMLLDSAVQCVAEGGILMVTATGYPAMLLDSAVPCVAEGGILMVTAVDMANLCGNNSTACYCNYGSYPIHRPYNHEFAVRIVLTAIEQHAVRYKRHITPLLSLCIDFYCRVFVRIETSPAIIRDTPSKLSFVWQSSGCDSFWFQPVGGKKEQGSSVKHHAGHGPAVPERCPETGSGYLMGGPIWTEPIHDADFLKGLMADIDRDQERYAQYGRIRGLVQAAADELPDAPLYYDLHDICKTARCQPPKMEMLRSALINAGFRVSSAHANPLAIKTDAPGAVLWDILRCWMRSHPVSMKNIPEGGYVHKLVTKAPVLEANFTKVAAAANPSKADGVVRYVQNPPFWGPKSRHGRPPVTKPDGTKVEEGGGTKQQQKQAAKKREREEARVAGLAVQAKGKEAADGGATGEGGAAGDEGGAGEEEGAGGEEQGGEAAEEGGEPDSKKAKA